MRLIQGKWAAMRQGWLIGWVLIALLMPIQSFAEVFQGGVVSISDGDTFTLLAAGNKQIRVRLAEIDCPESKQPYGQRAKQELSSLIFGKTVQVEEEDKDRYGRTVGRVLVEGQNVNKEMLRRGAAWVYLKYLKDQSLIALEAEAKRQQKGLWRLPESQRIPPWEWRHPNQDQTRSTPSQQGRGDNHCGQKTTCRQMTSCDEAKFYLTTCGVSSLDGNHDGIPCSKLCR